MLVWRAADPTSPSRPLRFLTAPGPALVRENVPSIPVSEQPSVAEIERLAKCQRGPAYVLFDLDALSPAFAAADRLHRSGAVVTAVRGRIVPADTAFAFDRLWLADNFAQLLREDGHRSTKPWRHPLVPCEAWRDGGRIERLGAVFSRLPDPGLLDVADIGRAGVREGAPRAALPVTLAPPTAPADLPALLDGLRRAACALALLIDNGGNTGVLARALVKADALGGFLGPARRRVPAAVLDAGLPVYTWFEAEDLIQPAHTIPVACHACALVPVALPGDTPGTAQARFERLLASGYSAIVPRFHLPVPATREWNALAAVAPLRHREGQALDGSEPLFDLPGWEAPDSLRWLRDWRDAARWPRPLLPVTPGRCYSLGSVHAVVDGFLHEARAHGPEWHARQLLDEVLCEVDAGELEPCARYPFVTWRGENVRDLVDRAINARLSALDGAPAPLVEAIRHTALAGGKRIRPILSTAIGLAAGAPVDAVLPAALSVEWLHTASLMQDDLPSMDDDPDRRRRPSAHVRHGEGLALLASDALVAMAVGDLAALGEHPAVGPSRATDMVAALAGALGVGGLVGGQARDLLARETVTPVDELLEIHRRKTAPLFRLAGAIGAILADLPRPRRRRVERLLADLGLAFQIVDDLLDADSAAHAVPGSDARNRRATFAQAMQRDAALRLAGDLVQPLVTFARQTTALNALGRLAAFVVTRRE